VFTRALVVLLVGLLLLPLLGCQAKVEAIVNGHRIKRDEVWAEAKRNGDAQRLLRNVVDTWLLEADAREKKIIVTDAEIDSIMKFSDAKGGLLDAAAPGAGREDLRALLKRNLLIAKMVVSEQDAQQFYNEHTAEFNDAKQVHLRRIVMGSRDEIAALRDRILKGELKFEDAAKASSVDQTTKASGGDWGWKAADNPPPGLPQVFSMQEGEVTEPLPAVFPEGAFQIVQVAGIREAVERSFDEVKAFVMLVMVLNAPANTTISQDTFAYFQSLWSTATVRISDPALKDLQAFYDQQKGAAPQPGGAPVAPGGAPTGTGAAPVPGGQPVAPARVDVPKEIEPYVPGSGTSGNTTQPSGQGVPAKPAPGGNPK